MTSPSLPRSRSLAGGPRTPEAARRERREREGRSAVVVVVGRSVRGRHVAAERREGQIAVEPGEVGVVRQKVWSIGGGGGGGRGESGGVDGGRNAMKTGGLSGRATRGGTRQGGGSCEEAGHHGMEEAQFSDITIYFKTT